MNYQAFTDDTLLLMHHAARGALVVDDELSKLGQAGKFRVRHTTDWIEHAAGLETEMRRRGMSFEAINWSEDGALGVVEAPALADCGAVQDEEATAVGDEGQAVDPVARLRSRIAAALKITSGG